jgi:hypothetical protein
MKKIENDFKKLETPAAGLSSYGGSRRGCKHGVHGSAECISHFLSEKNWKQSTIYSYLGIAEDVADHVANNGSTHPERQDKIPLQAAVAISQLSTKEVRQVAVDAVKEANRDQNEPAITAKEVKRIVKEVRSSIEAWTHFTKRLFPNSKTGGES